MSFNFQCWWSWEIWYILISCPLDGISLSPFPPPTPPPFPEALESFLYPWCYLFMVILGVSEFCRLLRGSFSLVNFLLSLMMSSPSIFSLLFQQLGFAWCLSAGLICQFFFLILVPLVFFFFYFLVRFAVLSSEFSSLYIVYVELLISKSFLFSWFILDSLSLWDIDYSSFWNSLLLPTLYLFFPSSFLFPPYFVLRAFLNFWYVAVWSYFMVKHWNTHWKLFGWSRLLTDRWTSLRVIGFCLFWRYLKWQFL